MEQHAMAARHQEQPAYSKGSTSWIYNAPPVDPIHIMKEEEEEVKIVNEQVHNRQPLGYQPIDAADPLRAKLALSTRSVWQANTDNPWATMDPHKGKELMIGNKVRMVFFFILQLSIYLSYND